ncbi:hypothetical protein SGPA1_40434 [Streptomyces misionensis JCM 4497]
MFRVVTFLTCWERSHVQHPGITPELTTAASSGGSLRSLPRVRRVPASTTAHAPHRSPLGRPVRKSCPSARGHAIRRGVGCYETCGLGPTEAAHGACRRGLRPARPAGRGDEHGARPGSRYGRSGLLAHERPADRGREREPGAHRRDQLVRVRDIEPCGPRPVVTGLQEHARPDRLARIQHAAHSVLRRHLQAGHHAGKHRLLQWEERRPAGPGLAGRPGQDRRLFGPDRSEGHPRPAPAGLQRPERPLVHQQCPGVDLARGPEDAGEPVRRQFHGRRHRPAQRAARPCLLGLW